MRYRDVVQFEPIDTVVQLRSAEEADAAAQLVATYVVSPHMAEVLTTLVIPQLQFARAADQKGLLIVGNYGTGKSHLLALLSAVAERADLTQRLRSKAVRAAAAEIAGRFQVIRLEIGATEMRLRDIVTSKLEQALEAWGIAYHFPAMTEVSNTKEPLQAMMAAFQERFPEQGLLLAVDELLDYLRTRDSQALILDLGFLRELGEVCEISRLRFIGGIQESLFDSPSFQFAADAVRRVKDRYEQVLISREDVTYVVSQRLLRKSEAQRAQVRGYLEPFAPLYPDLATRLETYVELFPVHPAYIKTFGEIFIVEKREVLKTLSREMAARLDSEAPRDSPGLIAYDSYWDVLRANPSVRSIADVRDVIDKSEVLEAKVQSAYTRPAYKPVALRIIHALSVHRLTTADLRAPIGVTAVELRDDLCLSLPMPEQSAEFLEATVGAALKEISRTVSGQFLSFNQDNGQWYLDVTKDVDYDALIQQRADTLSADQLDRAYYDALTRALELTDVNTHVTGFAIWEYEVEWTEKRSARPGYLFFGAPNQRSTAQPPREFYLYFLQPYHLPGYGETRQGDEVFFRLAGKDEAFDRTLRLYAAATMLAEQASSAARPLFREKAATNNPQRPGYLQQLLRWLQERAPTALEVTYQGTSRPAADLLRGRAASIRELVDQIASTCLTPRFRDTLPEYPTFPLRVTRANRAATATEALRWIAGTMKSRQGAEVLQALELLDGDRLSSDGSRYARHFREALAERGEGRVLNRADLIETRFQGGVEYDRRFHLEPEWLAVVLTALVYAGEITLALPGKKIDAASLDQAATLGSEALSRFSYIERPRDLPLAALTALFGLLGLPAGLIRNQAAHGEAVQALQQRAAEELGQVVTARARVAEGIVCWNATVVEGAERDDLLAGLDGYRGFLDGLRPYSTPGRLKSFAPTVEQVQQQAGAQANLKELRELQLLVAELQPLAAYLLQARSVLPGDDATAIAIAGLQSEQIAALRDPARRTATGTRAQLAQAALALKVRYAAGYLERHQRARLSLDQDKRKATLLKSPVLRRLQALRAISLLPRSAEEELERSLAALRTCTELTAPELATSPVCPHCNFRPLEEGDSPPAAARLDAYERKLERMEQEWLATLLQNLQDPTVQETLALFGAAERRPLERLLGEQRLPETVDTALVRALDAAFQGLERVVIGKEELVASLTNGGAPATVDELSGRLKGFLEQQTRGKNVERVRIVVE